MPAASVPQQQNIRAEVDPQPVQRGKQEDALAETGNDENDPDSHFAIDHGRTGRLHAKDTVSKKRKRKDKANDTTADDTVQPAHVAVPLKTAEKPAKPAKKKAKRNKK